jgi:hypothetical protein
MKKEQLNFTMLQGRQMPSSWLIGMISQPKSHQPWQPTEVQVLDWVA